jgi:hypothetical protein
MTLPLTAATLASVHVALPILTAKIAAEAAVYTDEAMQQDKLYNHFAAHASVNHGAEEYVRGDVKTNRVEGYFSIFVRGLKGVYQHCGKQHLQRYAAEFAFRYRNRTTNGPDDTLRAGFTLKGVVGKRVLYRDSLGA